jgi:hypothetical protein|tara:strand:+ start:3616 stop:4656 length:1041 start_codon:yes stop_codon:yes gene_type:complete
LQCGDSLCDNVPNIYDSTKSSTENYIETSCTDGVDNDCDGLTDCADSDCHTIPKRCRAYDSTDWDRVKKLFKKRFGINQITGVQFAACLATPQDTACCTSPDRCSDSGSCFSHLEKKDVDGDGVPEKCIVQSPGEWIEDVELDCGNGLDDDFDGNTDCADSDCDATLIGTVTDQGSDPISFVDISVKIDLTNVESATTAQDGTYSTNVSCGTYNLIASHSNYAPNTKSNVNLPATETVTEDFTMLLGSSCESDCTFAADDIVHASCDGKNGCSFYDDISKAACDLSQPGWIRDYDATRYVICPSGEPKEKLEFEASVTCSSGTLVKITRIVTYNGKPVKLVVATCG